VRGGEVFGVMLNILAQKKRREERRGEERRGGVEVLLEGGGRWKKIIKCQNCGFFFKFKS
jgi:hypothetical protein